MKWQLALAILMSATVAQAQPAKVLSAQKINKLLPAKIAGFHLKGESKSTQTKVGTLVYSISERTFASRNKSVKILLFDYADASIMYDQAMNKWGKIQQTESDSLIFRPADLPGVTGWESFTSSNNHAQLILGINNRFFLTMTGEKTPLGELKQIFRNFDLEKFPK
jgi:hypothetical protein